MQPNLFSYAALQRHILRICSICAVIWLVAALLVPQVQAAGEPPAPPSTWPVIISDCVTGDNAPGSDGKIEPDGAPAPPGPPTNEGTCDNWTIDLYERPLASGQTTYKPSQDLVEV